MFNNVYTILNEGAPNETKWHKCVQAIVLTFWMFQTGLWNAAQNNTQWKCLRLNGTWDRGAERLRIHTYTNNSWTIVMFVASLFTFCKHLHFVWIFAILIIGRRWQRWRWWCWRLRKILFWWVFCSVYTQIQFNTIIWSKHNDPSSLCIFGIFFLF